MKYILGLFLVFGISVTARSQTFEGLEELGKDYTCYHIDSNNVHCYVEDSDADLDLDNDGVFDREFVFSTPDPDVGVDNKDRENGGIIRNREPDFNPYKEEPEE